MGGGTCLQILAGCKHRFSLSSAARLSHTAGLPPHAQAGCFCASPILLQLLALLRYMLSFVIVKAKVPNNSKSVSRGHWTDSISTT